MLGHEDVVGRKRLLRDSCADDAKQDPSGHCGSSAKPDALKPDQQDSSCDQARGRGKSPREKRRAMT
jgi:hypothetical protein